VILVPVPFPAHTGDDPYVFVSYSHEDAEDVFPTLVWLRDQGINLWYDESISPGSEWREELGRAIRESSGLLFFASTSSVDSPHCRREVNDAIDQGISCLTVYLEDVPLPDGLRLSLSGIQAILQHQLSPSLFRDRLLGGVMGMVQTSPPTRAPLAVSPMPKRHGRKVVWSAVAALAVFAVLTQLSWQASQDRTVTTAGSAPEAGTVPGFSDRAAIAVLPFADLTDGGAQSYFADAITDDLVTGLQSFRSFPIIARSSTFQYRGSERSAEQIAKELGAGYLVYGSVRRAGDNVRVNVQLTNSAGTHLWAEKYDFEYANVLKIQDELTSSVLLAVEPELILSEAARARLVRTEDMEAWDYYVQAVPLTTAPFAFTNLNGQPVSFEQTGEARDLLLRALAVDSEFAAAYRLLNHVESWYAYYHAQYGRMEEVVAAVQRAVDYGRTARQISPFEPSLCSCLAADFLVMGDSDTALQLQEEALRENPSNALVRGILAKILQVRGNYGRALAEIEIAKRLGPRSMSMTYFLSWEADTHLALGDFNEAARVAQRSVLLSSENMQGQFVRILALYALGNDDEARVAVEDLRRSLPPHQVPFVLFNTPFPDSVASLDERINGLSFQGMDYQSGLDTLFHHYGWTVPRG
jgi:TolB-like protein